MENSVVIGNQFSGIEKKIRGFRECESQAISIGTWKISWQCHSLHDYFEDQGGCPMQCFKICAE